MAKDHGSSVNNDKQYEGLRKKGMSKSRAAAISNSEGSSSRGGKSSGSSQSRRSSGSGSGGNRAQKARLGARAERNQAASRGLVGWYGQPNAQSRHSDRRDQRRWLILRRAGGGQAERRVAWQGPR
jgi:hypothetical protein